MATASSTSKLYKMVVEDVINNVKEAFLDEGVDEQVLQELKQLWESKLTASKALEPAQNESELMLAGGTPQLVFQNQQQVLTQGQVQQTFSGLPVQINRSGPELSGAAATATMALPRGIFHQQMAALNAGSINGPAITLANGQLIAVPQLAQQQRGQAPGTTITIPHIPGQLPQGITMQQIRQATAIRTVNPNMVQPQQLHGMRTVSSNPTSQNERMAHPHQNPHVSQHHVSEHGQNPSMSQTQHQRPPPSHHQQHPPSSQHPQHPPPLVHQHAPPTHQYRPPHTQHQPLPHSMNHSYPHHQPHPSQQHVMPSLQHVPHAQHAHLQPNTSVSQQMYGMQPRPRNTNPVIQLDGTGDTSSSDDDDFDNDDDDDNENENENDEEAQGEEEEPLNSADDISEEDPNELFDTDNVVVCQYDKINRNKNKWKFHLKDGIMNLKGKDYVFQKASGEAEW
ncbi:hypothetical protein SNE40_009464 [Patella caerulea]|uniref:Transcription initiation factor IIA subunit 1 n=2 Tax=Patella caerulea TaxID=87958 RepID=A0AAN8PQA0_PATCE